MFRVGSGKNLTLKNTLEVSVDFDLAIYDLSLDKLLLLVLA